MLFYIITAYKNEYLTHYLNRNLLIPANWDYFSDMRNFIIL